jgi:5-methylcytosine-specific restriction endonuclease McrA
MLRLVDEGALSLTTIGLLASHLTDDNHESLLEAARHKSKREVEAMVAALHPQPDIPASLRMLPAERRLAVIPRLSVAQAVSQSATEPLPGPAAPPLATKPTGRTAVQHRDVVALLSPRRYLIRMTVDEETQQKFVRARDLLRHVVPDGDPGAIFDRALTLLLAQLERRKTGSAARPRPPAGAETAAEKRSRHVPAAVRRAVWARDQGPCAFIGTAGRCEETGALEFHHVVPFASGGPTTVDNTQLRCRSHNAYEGALAFGDWRRKIQVKGKPALTPSGRS